jgi:hypothetical protein
MVRMHDALHHTLEDQVRELSDRHAIADLLYEYCRRADLNDPEGIAACFTADCLADYGPGVGQPTRGAEARRTDAKRDLALFEATSHHLSNITIDFESPDRGRVRSSLYAWHRPVGGGEWHLWAQYHDVVVRTHDGWRISERRMLVAGADGFPNEWGWLPLGRRPI